MAPLKTQGNCAKKTACQFLVFCVRELITTFDETTFEKDLNQKPRIIEEALITEGEAHIFIALSLPRGSKDITGARKRVLEDLSILLPVLKTIAN